MLDYLCNRASLFGCYLVDSPLSHQHLNMPIRNQLCLKRQVRRSLLPRILEFDIILHQQLNYDQLDLVACEKTTGTGVPAISKCHTLQIASRPLAPAFDR